MLLQEIQNTFVELFGKEHYDKCEICRNEICTVDEIHKNLLKHNNNLYKRVQQNSKCSKFKGYLPYLLGCILWQDSCFDKSLEFFKEALPYLLDNDRLHDCHTFIAQLCTRENLSQEDIYVARNSYIKLLEECIKNEAEIPHALELIVRGLHFLAKYGPIETFVKFASQAYAKYPENKDLLATIGRYYYNLDPDNFHQAPQHLEWTKKVKRASCDNKKDMELLAPVMLLSAHQEIFYQSSHQDLPNVLLQLEDYRNEKMPNYPEIDYFLAKAFYHTYNFEKALKYCQSGLAQQTTALCYQERLWKCLNLMAYQIRLAKLEDYSKLDIVRGGEMELTSISEGLEKIYATSTFQSKEVMPLQALCYSKMSICKQIALQYSINMEDEEDERDLLHNLIARNGDHVPDSQETYGDCLTKALNKCQEYGLNYGEDEIFYIVKGEIFVQNENYSAALSCFNEALKCVLELDSKDDICLHHKNSMKSRIFFGFAEIFWVRRLFSPEFREKGVALLFKALKLNPWQPRIYARLADYYTLELNCQTDARICLEKAWEISCFKNTSYGFRLANALIDCKDTEAYERLLVRMALLNEDKARSEEVSWVLRRLGIYHLSVGNYDEAINSFTQVFHENPKDLVSWKGLAEAYANNKSYKIALRAFEEIFNICTQSSATALSHFQSIYYRTKMAHIHHKLGDHDRAILEYEKVLYDTPDYFPALLGLAQVYVDLARMYLGRHFDEKAKTYAQNSLGLLVSLLNFLAMPQNEQPFPNGIGRFACDNWAYFWILLGEASNMLNALPAYKCKDISLPIDASSPYYTLFLRALQCDEPKTNKTGEPLSTAARLDSARKSIEEKVKNDASSKSGNEQEVNSLTTAMNLRQLLRFSSDCYLQALKVMAHSQALWLKMSLTYLTLARTYYPTDPNTLFLVKKAASLIDRCYECFGPAQHQSNYTEENMNQLAMWLNARAVLAASTEIADYPLAHLCLKKCLAVDKNNHVFWSNQGVLNMIANKIELAKNDFKKSRICDPRYSASWAGLGTIAYSQGKYEEALNAFEHCFTMVYNKYNIIGFAKTVHTLMTKIMLRSGEEEQKRVLGAGEYQNHPPSTINMSLNFRLTKECYIFSYLEPALDALYKVVLRNPNNSYASYLLAQLTFLSYGNLKSVFRYSKKAYTLVYHQFKVDMIEKMNSSQGISLINPFPSYEKFMAKPAIFEDSINETNLIAANGGQDVIEMVKDDESQKTQNTLCKLAAFFCFNLIHKGESAEALTLIQCLERDLAPAQAEESGPGGEGVAKDNIEYDLFFKCAKAQALTLVGSFISAGKIYDEALQTVKGKGDENLAIVYKLKILMAINLYFSGSQDEAHKLLEEITYEKVVAGQGIPFCVDTFTVKWALDLLYLMKPVGKRSQELLEITNVDPIEIFVKACPRIPTIGTLLNLMLRGLRDDNQFCTNLNHLQIITLYYKDAFNRALTSLDTFPKDKSVFGIEMMLETLNSMVGKVVKMPQENTLYHSLLESSIVSSPVFAVQRLTLMQLMGASSGSSLYSGLINRALKMLRGSSRDCDTSILSTLLNFIATLLLRSSNALALDSPSKNLYKSNCDGLSLGERIKVVDMLQTVSSKLSNKITWVTVLKDLMVGNINQAFTHAQIMYHLDPCDVKNQLMMSLAAYGKGLFTLDQKLADDFANLCFRSVLLGSRDKTLSLAASTHLQNAFQPDCQKLEETLENSLVLDSATQLVYWTALYKVVVKGCRASTYRTSELNGCLNGNFVKPMIDIITSCGLNNDNESQQQQQLISNIVDVKSYYSKLLKSSTLSANGLTADSNNIAIISNQLSAENRNTLTACFHLVIRLDSERGSRLKHSLEILDIVIRLFILPAQRAKTLDATKLKEFDEFLHFFKDNHVILNVPYKAYLENVLCRCSLLLDNNDACLDRFAEILNFKSILGNIETNLKLDPDSGIHAIIMSISSFDFYYHTVICQKITQSTCKDSIKLFAGHLLKLCLAIAKICGDHGDAQNVAGEHHRWDRLCRVLILKFQESTDLWAIRNHMDNFIKFEKDNFPLTEEITRSLFQMY